MPEMMNLFGWLGFLGLWFWLPATAFWVWMIIDAYRHEDERYWAWLILILNGFGALIYFFFVKIPRHVKTGDFSFLSGLFLSNKIAQARLKTKTIGNAFQYNELADLLTRSGKRDEALEAYRKALKIEPDNAESLWGISRLHLDKKEYAQAYEALDGLLKLQFNYGFGSASLAMVRVLRELGRKEELGAHLVKHLKSWPHAEAKYTMALELALEGKKEEAMTLLEDIFDDELLAPKFEKRRNREWVGKSKVLYRKLKASGSSRL